MKKYLSLILLLVFPVISRAETPDSTVGKNTEDFAKVYASRCGAAMDSDVYKGGGTDDTDTLQAILDRAPKQGRLHLVLDGAARISRSLKVHSNTTIECPDKSCGLFLSDGSNSSIVSNANFNMEEIHDRNITLIGGVYNHNSPGQVHHREEAATPENFISNWVFSMEFYGVEQMVFRDVTIANQRTFALLMANWKYINMDNIHIDRRIRDDFQNQDGLHFFGPGRFLTIRDIRGNSGDDFIALAPDEHDLKSSIEDVLIQGVQLEDADQGIRLLVRGEGKLDRVVIRDVTGTYRSYGFIINPWFEGKGGLYGNIIFDTIDLRPMKNNYDYCPPFLFKLGGNIESITLKNIYQHTPEFDHDMFVIGGSYNMDHPESAEQPSRIDRVIVDGLYIDERSETGVPETYFRIKSHVGMLSIKDVILQRTKDCPQEGSLIRLEEGGSVDEARLNNVSAPCLDSLVEDSASKVKLLKTNNIDP